MKVHVRELASITVLTLVVGPIEKIEKNEKAKARTGSVHVLVQHVCQSLSSLFLFYLVSTAACTCVAPLVPAAIVLH